MIRHNRNSTQILFLAAIALMMPVSLSGNTIANFTFDSDVNPISVEANVTVSALGAGAGIPTVSGSLIDALIMDNVAVGGLSRDGVGFKKHGDSAWAVSSGVLSNSSTVDGRTSEGALAVIIDLAAYAGSEYNKIQLSFDFTTGEASETLNVHLWGYVDVNSTSSTSCMNLSATNGSAWETANGALTPYNLGGVDGVFTSTQGSKSDSAAILTGGTGVQSFSATFDLSSFTTAPNRVEDYGYLVLAFARRIEGTAPAVTISNLALSGVKSPSPEKYYSSSNGCVYLDCDDTGLNDLAGAITANDYMTFTVTPDSGYEMDLTSLTLKAGYSNSRNNTEKALVKSVLSSVDGFTDTNLLGQVATDDTVALDSSGDIVYEDLTANLGAFSQFKNISSATEFRIYIHDDTNYSIKHRMDDIVLSGKVSPISLPNAPVFTSDPIVSVDAEITGAYTGSIAGTASDPDGDPLTFSKVDGPAWLQVASDGTLSGTPPPANLGANSFTVQVSDNDEGSDTATLNIMVNDQGGIAPPATSAAGRIRLVWVDDPSTTVTVAWDQTSGSDAEVKYADVDYGRAESFYTMSKTVDRSIAYRGMENRFVRLTGLLPDTKYYFVLVDSLGVSSRYWFRTAPDTSKPFTFIAGGDSRNNRTPRQKANRMVAKLRPLFVSFTGDMINADVDVEWIEWMDDWQQTVSSDGRVYPLLPHRGNHESGGNSTIYNLFDTTPDNYYALTFGGDLLRYYVLNSESGESTQGPWMASDLSSNGGMNAFTHLMAGYHKPMRPHKTGKPDGSAEYNAWAQLFYDNRFKLVFESDTHTMKRTVAVRPSTETGADAGFIADASGTVYVGEGCWGAPLRAADDGKEWTLDMDSFNGFDWVHVYPEQVDVFTVKVDLDNVVVPLADGEEMSLPHGIDLWEASGGTRLVVNQGADGKMSYAQFQLDMFGGNQPPVGSKAKEDYDGDGISNFAEFAFGLNPTEKSLAGSGVLPGIAIGPVQQKVLSHRLRTATILKPKYYMAQDLSSAWTLMKEGIDYTLTTVPGADGYEDVQIELIGAVGDYDSAFFRVEID